MTAFTETEAQKPKRPLAPARSKGGTPRVVGALILREMSSTYGRSPGGYVWAVLEPVAAIVILAIGFSLLLKAPSLGTNFLLFYASGMLPLRFFQSIASSVGSAIQFNLPLMSYPRVTYLDTILARGLLAVLTQTMVTVIILAGIFLTQDIRQSIDPAPILEAFLLCTLLGVGLGVFNCFMFIRFPIWKTIWGIATRPLILISGVFYTFEDLPRVLQEILWFNPLIHIVGILRDGVYSTYDPAYVSIPFVVLFGLIPMVFGLLLLWRFGRDMLQR